MIELQKIKSYDFFSFFHGLKFIKKYCFHRYELLGKNYCGRADVRLPSPDNPSDHFPLAAKFLLRAPRKRKQ